jgi:hypothetical protein
VNSRSFGTPVGSWALSAAGLGVKASLTRGVQSTCIQVIGDSTGDATTEWFGLLGARLGAQYPAYTVSWRPWNDTNQWYDMPTTLQSGAAGERYAQLSSGELHYPGSTGITGDIDVRVKLSATDWTPTADSCIAAKWDSTGNQRSWLFLLKANGTLAFRWSTDGTSGNAVAERLSTVATGFTDGTAHWVRAVADVDNGAAGNDVKFYTSTDNVTWTQLGATVTNTGTSSILAGTASYQLGSFTAGFSSPLAGKFYWVEARSGIDGYSVVPPLPDDWDQGTNYDNGSITFGGAPVLMMLCGSQSGQNITYFNDTTRRPKLTAPHGQRLLFLNTGHNELYPYNADWISTYSAWVTDLKTNRLSGVPIVALAQNPTRIGTFITTQNAADVRTKRGAVLMSWASSQAGVYPLDVWPQLTDLNSQIGADNLHPSSAGHTVWANYVYNQVFR